MSHARIIKTTAAALFLLPALLLGACNQVWPVGQAPAPVATTPIQAILTVQLFIPSGIQSQYVSPATSSLRVQVGDFDTTLPLSAATCTAASGGQTCTFTVSVAPGAGQALTIGLYDGSSHLLSTVSGTIDILAGQANVFNLTLTGVAASATLTATDRAGDITAGSASSLLLDLGGVYTFGTALQDAAGQTIVNPGRPTETLSSSNPDFTVATTGTGIFTVTAPNPIGTAQSTTLTVKNASGAVLTTQVLTVPAQKVALTLSTSAPVAGSTVLATAQLISARGRSLAISGRAVSFTSTDGSFPNGTTATTDASGAASANVLTGTTSSTTGTVSATSDGITGSASYTSVVGTANTTTSTVTINPNAVKVNGTSTLTVTLKDSNGNAVTTAPTVTVSGGSSVGAVTQQGNVFTYPVTGAVAPGTSTFTVQSGGNTVGTANLSVTPYALTVSDGTTALTSGSSQYDFRNAQAHTFTVAEPGYPGAFTVTSSNPAVAAVSVSGGALTVTPGSTAGFSTITVKDSAAFGQTFTFTVSVTTAVFNLN